MTEVEFIDKCFDEAQAQYQEELDIYDQQIQQLQDKLNEDMIALSAEQKDHDTAIKLLAQKKSHLSAEVARQIEMIKMKRRVVLNDINTYFTYRINNTNNDTDSDDND